MDSSPGFAIHWRKALTPLGFSFFIFTKRAVKMILMPLPDAIICDKHNSQQQVFFFLLIKKQILKMLMGSMYQKSNKSFNAVRSFLTRFSKMNHTVDIDKIHVRNRVFAQV